MLSFKKGLKIAFEHEMVLSDCHPDSVPEPKWVTLYNEWTDKKNEYKRRFMTNEKLQNHSVVLSDIKRPDLFGR